MKWYTNRRWPFCWIIAENIPKISGDKREMKIIASGKKYSSHPLFPFLNRTSLLLYNSNSRLDKRLSHRHHNFHHIKLADKIIFSVHIKWLELSVYSRVLNAPFALTFAYNYTIKTLRTAKIKIEQQQQHSIGEYQNTKGNAPLTDTWPALITFLSLEISISVVLFFFCCSCCWWWLHTICALVLWLWAYQDAMAQRLDSSLLISFRRMQCNACCVCCVFLKQIYM